MIMACIIRRSTKEVLSIWLMAALLFDGKADGLGNKVSI
jgi:hypothetical protein